MSRCSSCVYCLYDPSVGGCVECQCDKLTEDELETYWTNEQPDCPYYEAEMSYEEICRQIDEDLPI